MYRFWMAPLCLVCMLWVRCASPPARCETHYNCAKGQFCVGGLCQTKLPDEAKTPGPDAFPSLEQVVWSGDGGQLPEPEPFVCQKSSDCQSEKEPNCWRQACVAGFLEFDFKKGHVVVDLSKPLVACKDDTTCKAWQQCYLGFCRDTVGTQSKATGKLRENGLFLGEYSYSEIGMRGKTEVLRIIMVGTFSDKLQKHLVIEFPTDRFTLGNHRIDGATISVRLLDVRTDFTPRRRILRAYGVGGTLRIVKAGLSTGEKVAGTASITLAPMNP